jgi:DNA invertase Pin-like site-specific DNA recombinase
LDKYLKEYLDLQFFSQRLIRTAAYVRCSHEEQKKHGFTVEAQKQGLQKYANEKGYIIVEWYIDEAKSARKKSKKRKELMRLVEDAKQKKFEMIIFKCIDRWFRNIQEYYKIQEVLEDNKINWECSEEEYDTTTREGRLKLNLYLMLAQDEADRGSERINYVFENKITNGEVITGSIPLGFKIEEIEGFKRLVVNEDDSHIIEDIFTKFELLQSKRQVLFFINYKHGLNLSYKALTNLLKNPLYYGAYRFNENYVYGQPHLTKKRWLNIQEILKKNVKATSNNHIYIFSGLLKCIDCTDGLVGSYTSNRIKRVYYYYRCNKGVNEKRCTANISISESKLEKKLLEIIKPEIKKYIASFDVKEGKKPKPKVDAAKVKLQLERLNNLYLDARISDAEYDSRYKELSLKLKLSTKVEEKRDLTYLKELLNGNFEEIYNRLDKIEKRALWRSFIKSLVVDPDTYEVKVNFL